MTDDKFTSLSMEDLLVLADREGLKDPEKYDRQELIEIIVEIRDEKLANRLMNNDIMRLKGKKYDIYLDEIGDNPDVQGFPIPDQYPETSIHLLLRDPYWAFAYWELNQHEFQELKEAHDGVSLSLKVYELSVGDTRPDDPRSSFDIPIDEQDSSWYINLPHPGSSYLVDLVVQSFDGLQELLCRSNIIESPGGVWLRDPFSLQRDKDAFRLFLAGFSDANGVNTDNILVREILAEIEANSDRLIQEESPAAKSE